MGREGGRGGNCLRLVWEGKEGGEETATVHVCRCGKGRSRRCAQWFMTRTFMYM